ncbi:oxidoreductase [Aquirufa aurantiipilula]|uniref:oxidoreductase n=1 Tax=Aquirufa aurantiipilula TaxID=2696561 RepID=UPI001CAA5E97|nr:oxidoreductase [Aquirufa aurantiipilula]MBZ1326596.1 SDR family oxidoreductase [Aquirufa aurantiipilula]
MNKLENKVIIVTGGNGLIGRAILKYIRSSGAIGINAELHGPNDLEKGSICCDVTSLESVKEALKNIYQKYGKIDGFVNNAYPRTPDWGLKFENIPVDSWRKNIDSQMNSVFICSQAVLEIMKIQGTGSIVNISSIYGTVGPDFTIYDGTEMTMPAAYSAIKGGIVNLSRYLASYYGPHGIRINCVSPGGIYDNQIELFVQQYEKKVPMRRMGQPEDIAPAVGFLLSDDSGYITGQNLMVDGGWTSI